MLSSKSNKASTFVPPLIYLPSLLRATSFLLHRHRHLFLSIVQSAVRRFCRIIRPKGAWLACLEDRGNAQAGHRFACHFIATFSGRLGRIGSN